MPKPERVFHTWDKWECYPSGFYESKAEGKTEAEAESEYASFLADEKKLKKAIGRVLKEWPNSCEHYLTNERMNRLAWMCKAAVNLSTRLPACYWPVFFRLPKKAQEAAYELALDAINHWMETRAYDHLTKEEAGINSKVDLY
jgi:hypothetical protein